MFLYIIRKQQDLFTTYPHTTKESADHQSQVVNLSRQPNWFRRPRPEPSILQFVHTAFAPSKSPAPVITGIQSCESVYASCGPSNNSNNATNNKATGNIWQRQSSTNEQPISFMKPGYRLLHPSSSFVSSPVVFSSPWSPNVHFSSISCLLRQKLSRINAISSKYCNWLVNSQWLYKSPLKIVSTSG